MMLLGYIFAILAGFLGTPVGNHNFAIVFVWIGWWALLILLLVPLFGRGWCAICPIPVPGEWLQRGAILGPSSRAQARRRKRWPRSLRNIWLQNIGFALLALFSPVLLTAPRVTAIVLSAMLLGALGLSLAFDRRVFCRYVCPVSGFIGLYSQAAPVELRVRDRELCSTCAGKPCYNGSASGFGCPWDVFPPGLNRNSNCGLCMECMRTCPHDNISIYTRPFGADLANPAPGLDQAFKALIMLASAVIYAAVLLGPWGWLKAAAYHVAQPAWWGYALLFVLVGFVLFPGMFLLASRLAEKSTSRSPAFPTSFARLAPALIPLGLMSWIAFSLSFVFASATYILASLSDPLGIGWDLFRTAGLAWRPLLQPVIPFAQSAVLLGGLYWSVRVARKLAQDQRVSALPVSGYALGATLCMLWLLL
jgi:ferredoxin